MVSPAHVAARRAGVDLRAKGSGNLGAANAGRVLGRRTGVVVAIIDIAKGALPALAFGAAEHEAGLVAGFAATMGHITSPLLGGRGGRGVATAGGAVLGSHPAWAPVVIVVWLLVFAARRWIALASVVAACTLPVIALVVGADRWSLVWAVAIALFVVVRHRDNLRRGRPARA